jgi:hypothetical protein
VTHTCNSSYSRGRDQEDCGSKPAWQIVPRDPIWKNPSLKRTGGVAQGIGPEFKPSTAKKKKKKKKDKKRKRDIGSMFYGILFCFKTLVFYKDEALIWVSHNFGITFRVCIGSDAEDSDFKMKTRSFLYQVTQALNILLCPL